MTSCFSLICRGIRIRRRGFLLYTSTGEQNSTLAEPIRSLTSFSKKKTVKDSPNNVSNWISLICSYMTVDPEKAHAMVQECLIRFLDDWGLLFTCGEYAGIQRNWMKQKNTLLLPLTKTLIMAVITIIWHLYILKQNATIKPYGPESRSTLYGGN